MNTILWSWRNGRSRTVSGAPDSELDSTASRFGNEVHIGRSGELLHNGVTINLISSTDEMTGTLELLSDEENELFEYHFDLLVDEGRLGREEATQLAYDYIEQLRRHTDITIEQELQRIRHRIQEERNNPERRTVSELVHDMFGVRLLENEGNSRTMYEIVSYDEAGSLTSEQLQDLIHRANEQIAETREMVQQDDEYAAEADPAPYPPMVYHSNDYFGIKLQCPMIYFLRYYGEVTSDLANEAIEQSAENFILARRNNLVSGYLRYQQRYFYENALSARDVVNLERSPSGYIYSIDHFLHPEYDRIVLMVRSPYRMNGLAHITPSDRVPSYRYTDYQEFKIHIGGEQNEPICTPF